MALTNNFHVGADGWFLGNGFDALARGNRLRLRESLVKPLLKLAQTCEVLVETRTIIDADLSVKRLSLIHDDREHTLARHQARVGCERRRIRILEVGPEQALVKLDR